MKPLLGTLFIACLAVIALAKSKVGKETEISNKPVVVMETSLGNIEIELDQKAAPKTVKNFLGYVEKKFYDNTVFHRVISNFMIQGGGFEAKGNSLEQKETSQPIGNEAKNGLKNDRGTIAMARTGDPNSATSQFFINVVDNNGLNYPNPDGHGYAVFGKVVAGMDVVDKIKRVKTAVGKLKSRMPNGTLSENPARDVPSSPVIMKSVRLK